MNRLLSLLRTASLYAALFLPAHAAEPAGSAIRPITSEAGSAKDCPHHEKFTSMDYLRTFEDSTENMNAGHSPLHRQDTVVKEPMQADGIVRLSKIEVEPQYLDAYIRFATEVGEISLRTEPGVLTLYAVAEKANPCFITILETYSSQDAYRKHIASAHFRKYKQGTLHMVRSLVLSDQTPLNPASQIINFIQ